MEESFIDTKEKIITLYTRFLYLQFSGFTFSF